MRDRLQKKEEILGNKRSVDEDKEETERYANVELMLIQEYLGHSSDKNTELNTYVSRATIKKMPVLLDEVKI